MLLCVHSSIGNCSALKRGTTFTFVSVVTQSQAKCLVPKRTQLVSACLRLFAGGLLELSFNYRAWESWKISQCSSLTNSLHSSLSVSMFCIHLFVTDTVFLPGQSYYFTNGQLENENGVALLIIVKDRTLRKPSDDPSSGTIPSPWVLVRPIGFS